MNWWYERWMEETPQRSGASFRSLYLEPLRQNKAVYSREGVAGMLKRGEISEKRAEELLHLSYEAINSKGDENAKQ